MSKTALELKTEQLAMIEANIIAAAAKIKEIKDQVKK